jgi:hypothetical protein
MKRIKLLTALALGVVASSSGALQVSAANYSFFVNFDTKEVANFDDYTQTFTTDTYNMDSNLNFQWSGNYRYDSCPTAFTQNNVWFVLYRLNGTGPFTLFAEQQLPDFTCRTTFAFYSASVQIPLTSAMLANIIDDDTDFVEFDSRVFVNGQAALGNRTLTLLDQTNFFNITYDFNTTYLFNYFLADVKFNSSSYSGNGLWTLGSVRTTQLEYVYTTAGNDAYYIYNNSGTSIGTTRKKYAIDYNEEFFRGESVGAQFIQNRAGSDTYRFAANGSGPNIDSYYNFYYLNTANLAQAIVDAPIISFTEEDCSGGFLDINVGCYVNNALAYIVNDAPVISDAFTLLNTGIELAAQTFGIIGNFSDDNVFGYLILVGFGFIAVKWFLKNDE